MGQDDTMFYDFSTCTLQQSSSISPCMIIYALDTKQSSLKCQAGSNLVPGLVELVGV